MRRTSRGRQKPVMKSGACPAGGELDLKSGQCVRGQGRVTLDLPRSLEAVACIVVSDSLWPHGPQHARPPCPSPTPEACSDSCPLSQWCHATISSSVEADVFSETLLLFWWSLVPLAFLNPAWTSGSSWFMYCWSLGWRTLSFTLLACEMSAIVQ